MFSAREERPQPRIGSTCSMPASVSSMSRPYSSVSKWTPGESDGDKLGQPRRRGCPRPSTLPAITSGTRASSIIRESASSTSAKWNGRWTRSRDVHDEQIAQVVESSLFRRHVGDVGAVGGAPVARAAFPAERRRRTIPAIDRSDPSTPRRAGPGNR